MEDTMRTSCLAAVVLGALGAGLPGPVLAAAEPMGDWLVADKVAVVRVMPCAPSQPALCGYIVWTKGPAGTDKNNPDPAKRSRGVIGLATILNMKPAATANKWEGEIYNAEDGKTYSGSIALVSDNVLRIEGCVLGFLCGGQNWTRTKCDDPLPPPRPGARKQTAPKGTTAAGPSEAPNPNVPTTALSCPEVAQQ
jgi:uncharacterized protein (DUF2147 family)